ncbi:DNA protecting protein DprA [Microterricola gilva]|uniref:DNA protecting protein DprA n=1 Tax=Microterricola gilva TaxID=393267 RepID=A0A4Q8AJW0_9MICO|nr:DNA-processing protein DprA [Microterricola gilva]RZU64780.1 DNA protecting protein DprA [Microterricola gilva]
MAEFGLNERELRALIAPLRAGAAGSSSLSDAAELFARAAWTGIAEPGDRGAGLLVTALGAATALGALIDNWPTARIAEAVDPAARAGRDALAHEISAALARWRPRTNSAAAVRALQSAARIGCRLAVPGDAEWPPGVDDLGVHAPLALWWRGREESMPAMARSIALVGARAATGYGEHVAMEASAGLVDRGFAIVSGAAYGIDGMVHRSALASDGVTVAFLAGGLDRFYPSGHDALLTRIVETGAVISELPCGAAPTRWRFLQRNRLIATSSQATVVLEAGHRSGSLNTAGHAAAAGRPLGAVPGPVTSPASAGCHRLLRDFDARCVTNAAEMAELVDVYADAAGEIDASRAGGADAANPDQLRVLDALSTRSGREVNDIAVRSGLSPLAVITVLGALELDGSAGNGERGWMRRV